jgi:hypothetical protein
VLLVVVVGAVGAVVVVLTPASGDRVERADKPDPTEFGAVATGTDVVVVGVDDAAAKVRDPSPAGAMRRGCRAATAAPDTRVRPLRGACGSVPAVATRSAMSARDTARITHQLGRPRTTRARRTSVVLDTPPTTCPPYARVTPTAPGGQAQRRR